MITNGNRAGQIFLSYSHTNDGVFFFSPLKITVLYFKKARRSSMALLVF